MPDASKMTNRPIKRGHKFLNTPGPTHVPDKVLSAMHRQTMDLSDPEFLAASMSCFEDLKRVFGTEGEIFLYAANGHGGWEAALVNTLQPGDTVLVPETGNFSNSWSNMTRQLGINVETIPGDWRRAIDPAKITERLKQDKTHEIKAVLLIQTETATGVTNDIPACRKAIDAAGHPALMMVDTIASLGTIPFRMDEWGVDVTMAASQKGLMMAPGLGLCAASEKAIKVHQAQSGNRAYWDWDTRMKAEHYRKFCGTAPQLMIFGLRAALDMIFEEGLETIFERHRVLGGATRAAIDHWSGAGAVELNCLDRDHVSDGVSTILVKDGYDADAIRTLCRDEMMVGLGGGLGALSGKAFRIGHMGDTNASMLYAALASVEATLSYMDVPHTPGGVTAAIEHVVAAKKRMGPTTF
jgi:alanine-glyoxylate transaminase/serine-glyoxylate transaminase/serine-pyruvate transaminase